MHRTATRFSSALGGLAHFGPFALFGLSALLAVGCACGDSHVRDDGGVTTSDAYSVRDSATPSDSGPSTDECPSGINPWAPPGDPANACSPEGRTCRSGGSSPCGGAMGCECVEGSWQCWVAEPDPVCWCGRTPSEGDPCNTEGDSCGEGCCTGIGGFRCVGGHWRGVDCDPTDCESEPRCPAMRPIGGGCSDEGLSCGDPCCVTPDICRGGRWEAGEGLMCLICPEEGESFSCGGGDCPGGTACTMLELRCGTSGAATYVCTPLPAGCHDCGCVPAVEDRACEVVDGRVTLREISYCD